jgi:AraC family transcriptional regulator
MKVMVIVKASPSSEACIMPSTELLTAMGQYNEELVKAGIMLEGAGLKPSSAGVRVRFSGKDRTVIDGPFAQTRELIAGYWIWKVKSLQEAIDWVKKCPNPMMEESDIEIRPFFEPEDFGEAFTPELREKEAAILAKTLGLNGPTFESCPDLILSGLNQSYTMETRMGIPQQWERFIALWGEIPSQSGNFYGVSWNTQPDCAFDYLTGVETANTENMPPDFTTLKIASRRYGVFVHEGHVSVLPQTIETIWAKWVPESGLKIARAPWFERYTPGFNRQTGMNGMEIWIPLED